MKPFDLEAAKRGEPICLYDGEKVHFVGLSAMGAVVYEKKNGDLFSCDPALVKMAPKKRTVWVNLYSSAVFDSWDSESRARSVAGHNAIAIAVPVEIEE